MGFRLIRANSAEYEKVITQQKLQALQEESKRWSKLTSLSPEALQEFISRFGKVKNGLSEALNQAKAAQAIEDTIHKRSINIAKIQGNMEISRISALLGNDDR